MFVMSTVLHVNSSVIACCHVYAIFADVCTIYRSTNPDLYQLETGYKLELAIRTHSCMNIRTH